MRRTILLAPGLGYLALLLVVPCLITFAYSLFERGTYGGIDYTWTLGNYQRAMSALFARIFLDSARITGTATLAALLVGYPAAYAVLIFLILAAQTALANRGTGSAEAIA